GDSPVLDHKVIITHVVVWLDLDDGGSRLVRKAQAIIRSRIPPWIKPQVTSLTYRSCGKPSSIWLASSSAFTCSSESDSSRLARLSWSCESFRAPMMGTTGTQRERNQASATCAMPRRS